MFRSGGVILACVVRIPNFDLNILTHIFTDPQASALGCQDDQCGESHERLTCLDGSTRPSQQNRPTQRQQCARTLAGHTLMCGVIPSEHPSSA